MSVSFFFSIIIYRVLTGEFERFERLHRFRIEQQFGQENLLPRLHRRFIIPVDPDLIRETRNRLKLILMIVNSGILIISGGLAYFLAGRTLQPIKEMVDEQNRFIGDASHEFRTPLTSLKTAMEVALRDKNLNLSQAKKLLSENIGEVNKLQSLSDQLLQLAQFEKPDGNFKLENASLAEIIGEAIRKITPLAKQKKISIKRNLQEIEVKARRDSLVDLFVILLDNAIKYSAAKKIIQIKSEKSDKAVLISVKDEGVGISEEDLPHIFDRFYRADSARSKDKTDGYGLGLSIAKKIVDMHKGVIKVKSIAKEGTVFTIQLPRSK
ncbi:hypothetical protein A2774_05615 [Candidatus Roizmanbacteria bacterium RIFCSPHIGHO2_01_FULL_39_12c]|uniref:histidine kinase n=1 Tax=Candidatus Roizmanbacteria bacterium RIFCSPHIGHO2_01_FULL_39_12c TaxID=1802031 RepID=A0A1F7GF50_9BACT|nr:MAG: hypothetical protein A2774_05615 [Candidatus Roizmanbacteria bacterium RIFCSPHIGHO2_01_FULL_39_12c]